MTLAERFEEAYNELEKISAEVDDEVELVVNTHCPGAFVHCAAGPVEGEGMLLTVYLNKELGRQKQAQLEEKLEYVTGFHNVEIDRAHIVGVDVDA